MPRKLRWTGAAFRVPNRFILDDRISYSAKKVGAVLYSRQNCLGACCMSLARIARLAGCSLSTAQTAVEELERYEYLSRRRRYGYSPEFGRPVYLKSQYSLAAWPWRGGFTFLPCGIFPLELRGSSFAVYLFLCLAAGNGHRAFPSLRRMSDTLYMCRATVCRALRELTAAGLIHPEQCLKRNGAYSSNSYFLIRNPGAARRREHTGNERFSHASIVQGAKRKSNIGGWSHFQQTILDLDNGSFIQEKKTYGVKYMGKYGSDLRESAEVYREYWRPPPEGMTVKMQNREREMKMMKKWFKWLPVFVLMILAVPLLSTKAAAYAQSGNTYTLYSFEDLKWFADQTNTSYNRSFLGEVVKLGADIDMSGMGGFMPIGSGTPFQGTFDGCGYSICNFPVTSRGGPQLNQFGLFAGNEGTIRNLCMENINLQIPAGAVEGPLYVGGIAAESTGQIINCSVKGSLSAFQSSYSIVIGGLVGMNDGLIINCAMNGSVQTEAKPYWDYNANLYSSAHAGGIAGANNGIGKISNSYSVGTVISRAANFLGNNNTSGFAYGGGIVGYSTDSLPVVDNCYSISSVTATAYESTGYAGGIVGAGSITNSYWLNSVVYGTRSGSATYSYPKSAADFMGPVTTLLNTRATDITDAQKWGNVSGINNGYPIFVRTISFNSKGGSAVSDVVGATGTVVAAPAAPTRTGYTFAGWYSDEALSGAVSWPVTLGAADMTLYAGWTINQYTVSYQSNGGSPVTAITQDYNTQVAAPAAPARTGYTFAGWYFDEALAGAVSWPVTLGAADMTLYAAWTINQYTVSFQSNGGSTVASITQDYNTQVAAPAAPARTGYAFGGWCSDPELTLPVSWPVTLGAADVTLYAAWTINQYTVSFQSNGGSSVTAITQDYNTQVVEPATPIRTGYTFAGWFTDEALSAPVSWPVTLGASDVTLYAAWIINQYTVSFQSNGGSAVAAITQDYNTQVAEPAAPIRTGYTFGGWFSDEGLTAPAGWPITLGAEDVTLYAAWTINQYTVSFQSNGGSSVTAITQDYNTQVAEPAAPIRTGYTFAGWFADEALAASVSWPVTLRAADMMLYADWTINQYTVSFQSNGGSPVTAITQDYNTQVAEPTAPIRTGYTFGGWFSDPELTAAVSWPVTLGAADVTFYAGWTINKYTVSFQSNGGSDVLAITLPFGALIPEPTAPTRTGYTFGGWNYIASGDGMNGSGHIVVGGGGEDVQYLPWDFLTGTIGAADITLYAAWTINQYTVSFVTNGGSDVPAIPQDYNTQVAEPAAPTRTGYTFGGWYTDEELTSAVSWPVTLGASDVTLYAAWTVVPAAPAPTVKKGTLRLFTADSQTGVGLAGAKYALFDDNGNEIAIIVSGDDGMIVVSELKSGTYSLLQLESAEGYEVDTDARSFTIEEDGAVVDLETLNGVLGVKDETDSETKDETEDKQTQQQDEEAVLPIISEGSSGGKGGSVGGKTVSKIETPQEAAIQPEPEAVEIPLELPPSPAKPMEIKEENNTPAPANGFTLPDVPAPVAAAAAAAATGTGGALIYAVGALIRRRYTAEFYDENHVKIGSVAIENGSVDVTAAVQKSATGAVTITINDKYYKKFVGSDLKFWYKDKMIYSTVASPGETYRLQMES